MDDPVTRTLQSADRHTIKLRFPSSSVYVRNIFEVVGALLRYKQSDGDGFDGSVSPAVVVDAACPIHVFDIVAILGRPPDVEIREFEVVPKDAAARPPELGSDGTLAHVVSDGRPQTNDARSVVGDDPRVAVLDATVAHQSEDVVADRFRDVGVIIQSPDVLQSDEDRLIVQSLSLEATHVTITNALDTESFRHR